MHNHHIENYIVKSRTYFFLITKKPVSKFAFYKLQILDKKSLYDYTRFYSFTSKSLILV